MANFKFTIAAVLLHITLGGILFAATEPTDNLTTKADYPRQGAFIAFYEAGAEVAINGTPYRLQCTPYRNDLNEWEAVETPTGDFIKIGENGTTAARIGGKYYTFLPE